MKSSLALSASLILMGTAHAGEIRRGATVQVAPASIWFQDEAKPERWLALKASGDAAELAAYQDGLLQAREAR